MRTPSGRYASRVARIRRRELGLTSCTLALGCVAGAAIAALAQHGVVEVRTSMPPVGTFVAEAAAFVLAFDLYFYGLHRLLHTRPLRRVHALHHGSRAPTVLTALAFHPLEGALILAFTPLAVWLVPFHLVSLVAASAFLGASLVLAHCGREPFPSSWRRVPPLAWYVTPSVHGRHHVEPDCNYGATLILLDRLCGTLRTGARVAGRRAPH